MRVESSSTSDVSLPEKTISEPLGDRSSGSDSINDFIVSDGS